MDEKVKQLKTYLSQYRSAVTHDRAVQVRDLIENMFLDELDRNEIAEAENARLRAALDFHPRAAKLMNKRKSFIVVADDEPYFHEVYSLIREHEIQKGTWTNEDQRIYEDATNALKGGE